MLAPPITFDQDPLCQPAHYVVEAAYVDRGFLEDGVGTFAAHLFVGSLPELLLTVHGIQAQVEHHQGLAQTPVAVAHGASEPVEHITQFACVVTLW